MPGTLFVVATPIGNLEDISARALRVLRTVELIAAEDTRRTAHLLAHFGITTRTTSLHEHNERQKTPNLVARLAAGERIALVTDAGTPGLSDPGAHLVAAARAAGNRVEPVPGASAVMTALSVWGMPVREFTFLGFPPIRSKDRSLWFEALASAGRLVVFFEAPHRVISTLAEVQRLIGDIRILMARELTKLHEELVGGPISEVLRRGVTPQGEFTILAELGLSTEMSPSRTSSGKEASAEAVPERSQMLHEFGQMTSRGILTRREAISILAKRHALSTREVYSLVHVRDD